MACVFQVEITAVEAIVEACGQDLRQVINHLQFFGSLTGGNQKDTPLAIEQIGMFIGHQIHGFI